MFKLLRRLVILLVVLLVLAIGALVFAGSALAKAVESGASYALGVPVTLDSAAPSPLSGALSLSGLVVSNPPGCRAADFLRMRSARTQVALSTLLSERVEIPSLVFEGIEIDLERNAQGTNYGAILEALERFESDAGKDAQPSRKKLVVRELVLRDVRVRANLTPELGDASAVELKLPELSLHDLGEVTVAELAAQTLEALLAATVDAGGSALSKDLLKDLDRSLDRLGKDVLDGVRARLGTSLERAGDDVRKAADGLGRQLEKVFK